MSSTPALEELPPIAQPDDELQYFETHAPPTNIAQLSLEVRDFIAHHHAAHRRVVLVSSGGTTVPLENQTVRFIDNFSAGTRGATSAEYFLEAGYAVVFLHRQFSLLPYSRHYSHSTNCFLDYLSEWGRIGDGDDTAEGDVVVKQKYRQQMLDVLRKYRRAKENKTLLLLPYTTVTSYLFLLREVAMRMQVLGSEGLFYLAAAVSDFFVPPDRMAEHKIQSGDIPGAAGEENHAAAAVAPGPRGKKLVIDLDPVPKFLNRLVEGWAPNAMIISFKLETDSAILLYKCRQALERYNHQLVIGNLLSTRKFEVVFVDNKKNENWIRVPEAKEGEEQIEIESLIVPEVVRRHNQSIGGASIHQL
ncbi:DNA/pantothenate metabolism flavoprotein [Pyronema omphalodes]|nr:DNA/pantothenate metabolism flavoprotein [Pyronema omphalodes]